MLSVARLRSGLSGTEELLKRIAELRASGRVQFAQAFDTSAIVSERHLLLAYENAKLAFSEKRNFSSALELEVLGRAAGTRRINEAISRAGVKSAADFILLFDGNAKHALGALDARELKPTFKPDAAAIAARMGIAKEAIAGEGLEKCVLEAVAMAGVE